LSVPTIASAKDGLCAGRSINKKCPVSGPFKHLRN
jgi:hypothetical protein